MAEKKFAPDSSIFIDNNRQSLTQFINVTESHEPVGGNIKYYFEKNEDTNFLSQFRKMRDMKDESTSFFVATFLNTDNLLQKFVMYMYQTLYFNLLRGVNTKLSDVYRKDGVTLVALPLQSDEKLTLYFKGGTTMKFIYDEFLDTLPQANRDLINNKLMSRFKASDTDMGLDIDCSSNKRYIIIKNALSSLITETCDLIGNNFDFMINDNTLTEATTAAAWRATCEGDATFTRNNPGAANRLPAGVRLVNILRANDHDARLSPHRANEQDATLAEFQDKIKAVKDTLLGNFNIDVLLNYLNRLRIIDGSNRVIACPDNPIICGMIIELIDYYVIMSGHPASADITNIKDTLNTGAHQQLFELYLSLYKMYTVEKRGQFLNSLHAKLNSDEFKIPNQDPANPKNIMKRIYYEKFSSGDKLIRRLQVDIPRGNIDFAERADFTVHANDDPYFTSRITNFSNSNKKHYTSVNASILDEANDIKTDFTLFRVKLNIVLDSASSFETVDRLSNNYDEITGNGAVNQILIPSEILDVSISGKHDTGHHVIINSNTPLDEKKFVINGIDYKLFIYSLQNHVNDLNFILFKQCGYTPWIDAKYDKRIDRLLFFTITNSMIAGERDKKIMKDLLTEFINFGASIRTTNPSPGKTEYHCDPRNIHKFINYILQYVINSDEYNFINISKKYYNHNFPNILFETYDLNTIPNLLEKLINCILVWGNVLLTERQPITNSITKKQTNTVIDNRSRSLLIKHIYNNNGINLSAIEPNTLIVLNNQNYLKFLKTVTDTAATLVPIML